MHNCFTITSYGAILKAFFGIVLVNPESMAEKRADIDYSNCAVPWITNVNFLVSYRNTNWILKFGLAAVSNFVTQPAAHKEE